MKSNEIRVGQLLGELSKKAPLDLAEEWDNVGLLLGDPDEVVKGVVIAVNLGRESLDEAAKIGANVIVCHHPPIFKPVHKFTKGALPFCYEAVQKGISVIALHTNFDLSCEELCKKLAIDLGAEYAAALAPRSGTSADDVPASIAIGKFMTYAPVEAIEGLRQALCKVGAGVIGEYSECSFSWAGEGTFKGSALSNPVVGEKEKLTRAQEHRLEMVFPWKLKEKIIATARKTHPYEEMAFDVVKLAQSARSAGYGFYGNLKKPVTRAELAAQVKSLFKVDVITGVKAGASSADAKPLKRIAFSPGSGSSFVHSAISKGVDAYICGEVGYHHMLDAKRAGMDLFILGHSYSERFFIETLGQWIDEIAGGVLHTNKVFEVVDIHF